jgi:hypothetical protein
VWLEATNTHARDVYAFFGFKLVAEVVVGEGFVSEDGSIVEGGEGFTGYGMIKEPSI